MKEKKSMSGEGVTVVTCARAPPQISGTGTVMYELLRHFPKFSIILFSRKQRQTISRDDRVLPFATYDVGRASSVTFATFVRIVLLPLLVLSMLIRIKMSRRPVRNVLAVFPDLDFLLASLVVAKILNVPIFVYLHDCMTETATQIMDKTASKLAEKWVFSKAAKVYAMSAPMEKYYRDRNLRTEALPHGVDASLIRSAGDRPCGGKPRVGIAGAVYETNGSAIKDLVDAKKASGDSFEIHMATSEQSIPYLRMLGVKDHMDKIGTFPSHSAMLDFLSSCDILFVPMSFESPNYKDLLTIFPTKVTDYWLAQKPILVYGPREYAFVPLAERDGYAKIVSERGSAGLQKAIQELCRDSAQRAALLKASRKMIELHEGKALAKRLMADLGITKEA